MASTLELLDAIDAQAEEDICIVDAVNRTISVPESLRLLGVESDEKAEIRRFRCSKIVGNNIDLTALILFINFENAGGQKGAYRIKDVEEEGDGTNITFSWELERKVTAYQGSPKFSLCAQRVKSGDDGTLEQEWNTTFNEECEVLEGLEVQESIEEEESGALAQIWQKIDELELAIDEGGLGGGIKEETDPTVPSWAKEPTKPTYTASEVGADASGTAETKVTEHNVDDEAHNDIRLLVQGLTQKLNALADSDDDTLDQLSEIVAYIKNNKSLIDGITTSKVNVSDIINNLTTNVSNKPLSAAQGVVLKSLIDGITIPEKLPNPYKLTFLGAVTGEYDGSSEQNIVIPDSSGGKSYYYEETLEEGIAKVFVPFSEFKGCKRIFAQIYIPDVSEESYNNYIPRAKIDNKDAWASGKTFASRTITANLNNVVIFGELVLNNSDAFFAGGGSRAQYTNQTVSGLNAATYGDKFTFDESETSGIYFEIYNRTNYSFPAGTKIVVVGM